mmetsp:Transcript_5779/g.9405  ORF Transcript_5779/g.9405 Transcript_5779/m.9405 type:complete len:235 (+) Transcript_5779:230-934(+)
MVPLRYAAHRSSSIYSDGSPNRRRHSLWNSELGEVWIILATAVAMAGRYRLVINWSSRAALEINRFRAKARHEGSSLIPVPSGDSATFWWALWRADSRPEAMTFDRAVFCSIAVFFILEYGTDAPLMLTTKIIFSRQPSRCTPSGPRGGHTPPPPFSHSCKRSSSRSPTISSHSTGARSQRVVKGREVTSLCPSHSTVVDEACTCDGCHSSSSVPSLSSSSSLSSLNGILRLDG